MIFKNENAEISGIADLNTAFKQSKSLGVVCKTELQAKIIADKLKAYTEDIYFFSNQSSAFVQDIIINSAHMAKGLEFDEVIIPQVADKNYHSEIDQSMLYVAITRAMHRLTLTYCREKSRLLY